MSMKPMNFSDEPEVRAFHCKNCGAPLEIPKTAKGVVVCQNCNTENVITNLVKNMEIIEKENINSGISLKRPDSILHDVLVDALTSDSNVPLDILKNTKVKRIEHIMVPCYCFSCNATAPFSYEVGVTEKKYVDGESKWVTEWYPEHGNTSASGDILASGNSDYKGIIDKLYRDFRPDDLTDIEDLEYPSDSVILSYNYPQTAAFDNCVKSRMEDMLYDNARDSLSGNHRNIKLSGAVFQKDYTRVLVGVYKIVCEYLEEGADKDKAIPDEFNVYISSNGKNYYAYGLPSDSDKRERKWKYKEVIEATKKRRSKLWKWFFLGLIGFCCLGAIHYLISVFGVIGLIILLIIIKKVKYDRVINEAERLIEEMADNVTAIRDEFKKSSSKIHGFEECAVKK